MECGKTKYDYFHVNGGGGWGGLKLNKYFTEKFSETTGI